MTLPRFTSGQLGRLDFSHLNDAFGYIDLQRGTGEKDPRAADEKLPLIIAQLGIADSNLNYAWAEHVVNEQNQLVPLTGGRTSASSDGNQHAFPARVVGGSANTGDFVVLTPKRTKQGKIYYAVIPLSAGAVEPYMVVGIQQLVMDGLWVYRVKRAYWYWGGGGTLLGWQVSGGEETAFNTCENPRDDQPALTIGVGSVRPQNIQATRKPIKTGTVALASRVGSFLYFSVPNGYSYTCPGNP